MTAKMITQGLYIVRTILRTSVIGILNGEIMFPHSNVVIRQNGANVYQELPSRLVGQSHRVRRLR